MALDYSLKSLQERCIEILKRDLSYLMQESASKKLSAASARDLVAYLKLLDDLKSLEDDELSGLTDETLEALASGNSNPEGGPSRTPEEAKSKPSILVRKLPVP